MPSTTSERLEIRRSHPDSWVAVEEGDTIYGTLADVTDAWSNQRKGANGQQGSWYPLLTLADLTEATGYDPLPRELKVHCFGTVLFNEITRQRPQIGDRVRVTYKGEGQVKVAGQHPPTLYAVRVEGDRADVADRVYDRIQSGAAPGPGQRGGGQQTTTTDDDIPF